MSSIVTFRNVSKSYRLGEGHRSLRQTMSDLGCLLVGRKDRRVRPSLWALRDVSFNIKRGEVVGVIGPNGAGKTTILKLISRITQPTSGRADAHGRVAALIELGAGFHPDLTGRENVFLNAAILGMRRSEVKRRFDEIIAFSGLERFLDTPVKRYSSGMYVRLAFSIAAHTQADILLVDEVLAVGDVQFRQRCLDRIRHLRRDGTTIVFVSHNLYLIEGTCDWCLFLTNGQIRSSGDVPMVLNAYEDWRHRHHAWDSQDVPALEAEQFQSHGVEITHVEVQGQSGMRVTALDYDVPAEIVLAYRTSRRIAKPNLYLKILGKDGTCCMIRTADYGIVLDDLEASGTIRVAIDPLQLTPGAYTIDAELLRGTDFVVLAEKFSERFYVRGKTVGREGVFVPHVAWARVELPSHHTENTR